VPEPRLAARLEVHVEDERAKVALLRALLPDVATPASPRVRASLRAEGDALVLEIEASDLSGLRAAVNSYLRLMHSVDTSLRAALSSAEAKGKKRG